MPAPTIRRAGLRDAGRLRLQVRVGRRDLDSEIAKGACLDADPARSLRARQLGSMSERHAIAASLANILDAAEECQADPASRLALNHGPVIAARHEILALVELLRSEATVDVRGVALARLLARDPASPLLRACSDGTLQQAVSEIVETVATRPAGAFA